MKKLTMAVVAGALLAGQAWAAEWLTDLPKAQAQAKKEQKLVMINFTGSDWCPWCWKLRDEIFKTPEFEAYAKKSLVLVEMDFPRKTKLPEAQAKSNQALSEKYNIEGFPTVVVLNGDGKEVGRLGYQQGGPKGFTAKLDGMKGK